MSKLSKEAYTKEEMVRYLKKYTLKYVYSLPTKGGVTIEDYLKGIGGSNGGKLWSLFETISGKDAA